MPVSFAASLGVMPGLRIGTIAADNGIAADNLGSLGMAAQSGPITVLVPLVIYDTTLARPAGTNSHTIARLWHTSAAAGTRSGRMLSVWLLNSLTGGVRFGVEQGGLSGSRFVNADTPATYSTNAGGWGAIRGLPILIAARYGSGVAGTTVVAVRNPDGTVSRNTATHNTGGIGNWQIQSVTIGGVGDTNPAGGGVVVGGPYVLSGTLSDDEIDAMVASKAVGRLLLTADGSERADYLWGFNAYKVASTGWTHGATPTSATLRAGTTQAGSAIGSTRYAAIGTPAITCDLVLPRGNGGGWDGTYPGTDAPGPSISGPIGSLKSILAGTDTTTTLVLADTGRSRNVRRVGVSSSLATSDLLAMGHTAITADELASTTLRVSPSYGSGIRAAWPDVLKGCVFSINPITGWDLPFASRNQNDPLTFIGVTTTGRLRQWNNLGVFSAGDQNSNTLDGPGGFIFAAAGNGYITKHVHVGQWSKSANIRVFLVYLDVPGFGPGSFRAAKSATYGSGNPGFGAVTATGDMTAANVLSATVFAYSEPNTITLNESLGDLSGPVVPGMWVAINRTGEPFPQIGQVASVVDNGFNFDVVLVREVGDINTRPSLGDTVSLFTHNPFRVVSQVLSGTGNTIELDVFNNAAPIGIVAVGLLNEDLPGGIIQVSTGFSGSQYQFWRDRTFGPDAQGRYPLHLYLEALAPLGDEVALAMYGEGGLTGSPTDADWLIQPAKARGIVPLFVLEHEHSSSAWNRRGGDGRYLTLRQAAINNGIAAIDMHQSLGDVERNLLGWEDDSTAVHPTDLAMVHQAAVLRDAIAALPDPAVAVGSRAVIVAAALRRRR